jgi:hypothetical protein
MIFIGENLMSTVAQKPVRFPSPRLKGMKDFMDYVQDPIWKPSLIDVSVLKKMGNSKGKEDLTVKALRFLLIFEKSMSHLAKPV